MRAFRITGSLSNYIASRCLQNLKFDNDRSRIILHGLFSDSEHTVPTLWIIIMSAGMLYLNILCLLYQTCDGWKKFKIENAL